MKKKKAFTIIELLIVITIIGILGGLIVPGISKYINMGKEKYHESWSFIDIDVSTLCWCWMCWW